jgi:hypothetical protein
VPGHLGHDPSGGHCSPHRGQRAGWVRATTSLGNAGWACLDQLGRVMLGDAPLEVIRQFAGCRGEPLPRTEGHRLHVRTRCRMPPEVERCDDEARSRRRYRVQLAVSGYRLSCHE